MVNKVIKFHLEYLLEQKDKISSNSRNTHLNQNKIFNDLIQYNINKNYK